MSFALRLAALGVMSGLYGCNPSSTVEEAEIADAVYFNGKIITVDDQNPRATAVAIKDGKVIYVGDIRGSQPLMAASTQEIDLQGKTMLPGFVDAHGHVVNAGIQAASANLLPLPDGSVNSFTRYWLQQWTAYCGRKNDPGRFSPGQDRLAQRAVLRAA